MKRPRICTRPCGVSTFKLSKFSSRFETTLQEHYSMLINAIPSTWNLFKGKGYSGISFNLEETGRRLAQIGGVVVTGPPGIGKLFTSLLQKDMGHFAHLLITWQETRM